MSLTCCIESHRTPATLSPAHTPCLLSIDLHTIWQHLVIDIFHLLLPLSGTLFQMMSGVPHHCHFKVSFDDILVSFGLQRLNFRFDHCAYVHYLALQ